MGRGGSPEDSPTPVAATRRAKRGGRKPRSEEDREAARERRKQQAEQFSVMLDTAVDSVTPDSYREWLQSLPRTYRYSFNNYLLIHLQRPESTKVQSAATWNKQGRLIRPGEHKLMIIGPKPFNRKVVDRNGSPVIDPATGEQKVDKSVYFDAMPVFDYSQTIPMPERGSYPFHRVRSAKDGEQRTITLVKFMPGGEEIPVESRSFPVSLTTPIAEYQEALKEQATELNHKELIAAAALLEQDEATNGTTSNPDVRKGLDDLRALCEARGVKLYRDGVDDPQDEDAATLRLHALKDPNAMAYYAESEIFVSGGQPRELKAIYVRPGVSDEQALHDISHELGHNSFEHLRRTKDGETIDKTTKELEAEGFAYAVCCRYGVEPDFSPNYITNWASSKGAHAKSALQDLSKGIRDRAKEAFEFFDEREQADAEAVA
jgi:hypothetical protein